MKSSLSPKSKMTVAAQSENVQVTVRCRPPKENEHGVYWDIKQNKIVSKDQRNKKQHEFLFGNKKKTPLYMCTLTPASN